MPLTSVTRHIPMRRELKAISASISTIFSLLCHKAYPDEKGTERHKTGSGYNWEISVTRHIPMRRELKEARRRSGKSQKSKSHKAYPDEKGTESLHGWQDDSSTFNGHKAYPDEKGTER